MSSCLYRLIRDASSRALNICVYRIRCVTRARVKVILNVQLTYDIVLNSRRIINRLILMKDMYVTLLCPLLDREGQVRTSHACVTACFRNYVDQYFSLAEMLLMFCFFVFPDVISRVSLF